MSRFKRWLFNKFLPAYCKEELLEDNALLERTVAVQRREIARLKAYISGLERGFRAQKKIVIKGGGVVERPVRDLSQPSND